jgi:fucose permease
LFLLGFSFGFLTVALDALFSEIYRKSQARYLNILHFFFGVGSFLGPLLTVGILKWMDGWVMFYFLIGLCHVPLVMIFPNKKNYRFTRDASKTRSIEDRVRFMDPLRSLIFWVILLAMFLHLGVEVSFSAWLPLFLVNIRNLSVTTGSYTVSLFWLAFLVGRALYARFSHRIDLSLSLIIGAGGAALFMGLTFLGREPRLIFPCAGCAGILISCVYPNLLALGGGFFPRHIGFIMGTISASGGIGYMFFPWLIGPVSQYFGLAKGVFMIPLLGLGMVGILIVLRYSEKERSEPRDTALV